MIIIVSIASEGNTKALILMQVSTAILPHPVNGGDWGENA